MSIIKVPTLENLSGVEVYTAKAWLNLNGTGTIAIRGSANVSSVTDVGIGNYRPTFISVAGDENWGVSLAFSNEVNVQHGMGYIMNVNPTNVRVLHHSAANAASTVDKAYVLISCHW